MRFVSYFLNDYLTVVPETLVGNPELKLVPFGELPELESQPLNSSYDYDEKLQQILYGKMLLFDELHIPLEIIHEHYENGFVMYNKGVKKNKYGWQCNRCNNEKDHLFASFSCFRCKSEKCVYCRNCIMMGRVSMCTPLLSWTGPEVEQIEENQLVWEGELSAGQKTASDRFVEQVGKSGELLIWAVCGAGKTEVLFHGIEKALKLGLRVCIATPRTDVVLELAPRLKKAFPTTLIASYYGGSDERETPAQLVLSTTHQLYRFKQAFNLMIVDEVDAFPYSYDKTLQHAVSTSTRTDALRLYLSATPSRKMKKEVTQNKLPCVKIPIRFHGFPLPVPKIVWSGEWKKRLEKGKLPPAFLRWVKSQAASERRAMIFVPSVTIIDHVTQFIRKQVEVTVDSVHAEDPLRKEKVVRFRQGDIQLLVTTTILERGVTVPFLDVAIFGTDHEVFSESALVQMAGRAGRSKNDHDGQVLFFHYGKSLSMLSAIKHIREMNKEAGF
ncbi:DEAD/DEAH box helicase [Fictibacillus phosphorivorans]|uniref:DEAD/DEAH box helicase n=1 Tax=Fictibacillus phosphorivorans TaxID=1221500 RepID=UPI002041C5C2|nr:DEAD/DEAH box helicase [Fictibacillus phosphorivorans]MCM3718472.1 DEAD/DEAH box helicase [Fictibacillus phosphorivorans]MCM3776172.1 DEAD/DEAH box helicase [Fictibacillus phosphorivorans]